VSPSSSFTRKRRDNDVNSTRPVGLRGCRSVRPLVSLQNQNFYFL
jgi:hypothetical protein